MITLFNPRKKRKKASRSRRRRKSALSGYYSPCSKGGRRRYNKAVRRCKLKLSSAQRAREAKAWHGGDSRAYMSSGLFSNGRRRRRARNTAWVPSYAINPGGILKSVKQGLSLSAVKNVVPLGLGALGNVYARRFVRPYLPGFLQNQWSDAGVGIATAGLLAYLTRMVRPAYANEILSGGLVQVISGLFYQGLQLGDYLTTTQAADARPLGGLGQMSMSSWIPSYGNDGTDDWAGGMTVGTMNENQSADAIMAGQTTDNAVAQAISADGIDAQGLGDYLTTSQAADARPLG